MKTPRLLLALSPLALLLAAPTSAGAAPIALGPDFNGDGAADHVIGALDSVVVRYGDAKPTEVLRFTEAKAFGETLAAGDFNDDGYDDLAVSGILTRKTAGEVRVFWGHSYGLMSGSTQPTPQVITQADIAGKTTEGALFGSGLAAGDVTGDGVDDLAIGAFLHSRSGAPNSGIVSVVPGASGTPLGGGDAPVVLSQDSPGVAGTSEEGDGFGYTLAIGDVTGDGTGDLVVDAVGENDLGMVHVLPGGSGGPSGEGSSAVSASSVPGVNASTFDEGGDAAFFGASLAVGDVTGDGNVDVVAGNPFDKVGKAPFSGSIAVLRGNGAGIDASRAQLVSQASSGVVGAAESYDVFGWAVAAGDLDGDDELEVVAAVRGESIGSGHDHGAYAVLHGSSAGVTGAGSYAVSQNTPNVPGTPESEDSLGTALALQDVNADGRDDVIVSAPGEDAYGITDTGTAATLLSDTDGRPGPGSSAIYGKSYAVKDLGRAIAAGPAFGVTITTTGATARAGAATAAASVAAGSAAARAAIAHAG